MITVEVIQMAVKANHDISSGLDTAFINIDGRATALYGSSPFEFK